jgi:hypothetical protein
MDFGVSSFYHSTSVGAGSPKATSELQKSCIVELSHS